MTVFSAATPLAPGPVFCDREYWGREDETTQNGRRLVREESGTARDEDDRLVQRIGAGDEGAFGQVARAHAGRLRALALGFSGGAAEADDVVQETFWSLWRNAKSWKPGGPPLGAYLTRIAVNRAIDRGRRRKIRNFFGLEDAADVADSQPAQDERLSTRRDLADVLHDIGGLPERQRAAVLLAADGERSNAEIAAALGISIGAAEQLLVRARRKLRTKLAARAE